MVAGINRARSQDANKPEPIGNAAMSDDDFNNDNVFKVAVIIGVIVVVTGLGGLLTLL